MSLVGGIPPSEKDELVSLDDDIPNIWKVKKIMFQTTNQVMFPVIWRQSEAHFATLRQARLCHRCAFPGKFEPGDVSKFDTLF